MTQFPQFAEFFTAATGRTPYLWQQEAARRLLSGEPLDAISVPTGLGKTHAITAWVWAFAAQQHELATGLRHARTIPTRLHYLVDRRVLIDDTYTTALRLAQDIESADDGPLAALRVALGRTARTDTNGTTTTLDVLKLRGGMGNAATHTTNPVTPAIVCSTIDLYGSRLLWRGYGVSRGRRPIDAALTGADTLVVLDEAHIAEQLSETLGHLDVLDRRESSPLPHRQVVRMSATPGRAPSSAPVVFDRAAEEAASPALAERLSNRDAVSVNVMAPAKPADCPAVLAGAVRELLSEAPDKGVAVGVLVNTVKVAQQTADQLRKDKNFPHPVRVLHGGIPAPVRQVVLDGIDPYRTGHPGRDAALTTVVIATQTLEVGADLDLDHLVTQSSSLTSFLQRAGRVNRVGARPTATILVLPPPSDAEASGRSLYGGAPQLLAGFLTPHATMGRVIAGVEALDDVSHLNPPPEPLDVIDQVVLYDYLLTDGMPGEPSPGVWIRPQQTDTSVQVIWRDALDSLRDESGTPLESAWVEYLRAFPPHPTEVWSLSFADLIGKGHGRPLAAGSGHVILGPTVDLDEDEILVEYDEPRRLRWGSMVILPTSAGGLDPLGYLHTGVDLSGFAAAERPVPVVLTSDRAVATPATVAASPAAQAALELDESMADDLLRADLASACAFARVESNAVDELTARAHAAHQSALQRLTDLPDDGLDVTGLYLGLEQHPRAWLVTPRLTPHAGFTSSRLSLAQHSHDVADLAATWATVLGLSPEIVATLRSAGTRHDLGKLRGEFQATLAVVSRGGQLVGEAPDEPLAKSSLPDRFRPAARRIAALPSDFRHEALSVALSDALPTPDGVDPELLRHLIGAHHGRGRGLFPVGAPLSSEVYVLAPDAIADVANPLQDHTDPAWAQWAQQFDHLNRRYGPYTLALLETVLRLADWQASAEGDVR